MSAKWCIYCSKYDLNTIHSRGYRCNRHQRPMAIDENCPSWSDGLRSDKTVEEAIKRIKKYGYNGKPDSSYWYVTSTVSKIAGLQDENNYLLAFKKMKDYLLNSQKGIEFLINYDFNGVFISKVLLEKYEEDKDNTEIFVKEELLPQFDVFAEETENDQMENAFACYESIMDYIATYYHRCPCVNAEGYIDEQDNIVVEDNSDGYCRTRA